MNINNQFALTITINKKVEKSNITFSISEFDNGNFATANFTGSIVEANGLTYIDEAGNSYNYDQDLKGLECLLFVDNFNLAESAISSAEQIFANRSARKDNHNRIYFDVIASGFQVKLQDEEAESDENRSKLIITKISSIEVKGKLSVSAFKDRLATLKARSAARRVKSRSNGLFRPQQEVVSSANQRTVKANTGEVEQTIDVKSVSLIPTVNTLDNLTTEQKDALLTQLLAEKATVKRSNNGGVKVAV